MKEFRFFGIQLLLLFVMSYPLPSLANWVIPLCRNAGFHPNYWTEEEAIEITWNACPGIAKDRYRSIIWQVTRSNPGGRTGGACCRVWDDDSEPPCPQGQEWFQELQKCLPDNHCQLGSSHAFTLANRHCLPPSVPPNSGDPSCSGVGNPINFSTGAKFQREVDYAGDSRPMSVDVTRYYNSNNPNGNVFGPYWSSVFDATIVFNEDQAEALVILDDGKGESFSLQSGEWLSNNSADTKLLNNFGKWIFTSEKNISYIFNLEGKIEEKVAFNGKKLKFEYLNGRIQRVQDDYGNVINFEYSSDGRIKKIAAPAGDYAYEFTGGLLSRVSFPDSTPLNQGDNPSRRYLYGYYEIPYLLRKIVDESGHAVSSWRYDQAGRAISSARGNELDYDQYLVDYKNLDATGVGIVEVVNPLGKKSFYHITKIRGKSKIIKVEGVASANCAAANKAYDYYSNGTLKSKTDWSGNVTTYVRDNAGRETSRTEAAGTPQARTITTQYHATLNVPIKITEPGLITDMTYDTAGRLLTTKKTAAAQ